MNKPISQNSEDLMAECCLWDSFPKDAKNYFKLPIPESYHKLLLNQIPEQKKIEERKSLPSLSQQSVSLIIFLNFALFVWNIDKEDIELR